MSIFNRVINQIRNERIATYLFWLLIVATIVFTAAPQAFSCGSAYLGGVRIGGRNVSLDPLMARALTHSALTPSDLSGATFTTKLAQTKFVQGDNGVTYLDVSITAPDSKHLGANGRNAADLVVVLDRSASMAAENKFPYAKQAIKTLLERLGPNDRFGLVSFATDATIHSELAAVTDSERERLLRVVDGIGMGPATNISDGLNKARELFGRSVLLEEGRARNRRVILLSDGEANTGIIAPAALAEIARGIGTGGLVLSTIGMGLGFNETLMSSLADNGMGNYAYLETLEKLGGILTKDLDDARNIFATRTEIEFRGGNGTEIVDAGGYPVTLVPGSLGIYRIATGQLLSGSSKRFVISLRSPATLPVGEHYFGQLALDLWNGDRTTTITASKDALAFAVVAPERRDEAVASVDAKLYQELWAKNNVGILEREVSEALRQGDKSKADGAIGRYRDELKNAENEKSISLASPTITEKLGKLSATITSAFEGTGAEQHYKQNSYGKRMQMDARESQREMKSN